MNPALQQPTLTFEDYIDFCAQTNERYELVRGKLKRMNPPTVLHYRIAKFLEQVLDSLIEETHPGWEVFRNVGQRTEAGSSRLPNIAIVPREEADQLLHQTAVFQTPSLLVVEIVSPSSATEDYADKLEEFKALGIQEIWIVDPEGLGAAKYIGFPKLPTISVYSLKDGTDQVGQFRGEQRIQSALFAKLNLTAEQIFRAKV
jgi:Uma2 family endonuclease